MKIEKQIKDHIHNLETELLEAQEWADKAYIRYHEDKKAWGEGDYGETSAANEVVAELENQIRALKWVLGE